MYSSLWQSTTWQVVVVVEVRSINTVLSFYPQVLHTVAAIATLSTIPDHRASLLLTSFSLTSVSCGWIAFVLFVFQILLMDRSQ